MNVPSLTLKFQNEEIALGERYGDSLSGVRGRIGADYLAGGSGMILSHKTVTLLHFYIRRPQDEPHQEWPGTVYLKVLTLWPDSPMAAWLLVATNKIFVNFDIGNVAAKSYI